MSDNTTGNNGSFTTTPIGDKEVIEVIDNPIQPAHYGKKTTVMDFIEEQDLNFARGNIVKYTARAGKKDPTKEVEDLLKARWYIDREIEVAKQRQL